CDDGCDCAIANPKATLSCPGCQEFGEQVSNLTVYSLTQKEHKTDIERKGNDHFNICMNPACSTGYYNKTKQIKTSMLKRDMHFKEDAKEHYVCYCLNITKDQVVDTILKERLTGMKDIMNHIQGPPPCSCEKNNPTGLCCDEIFNDLIKETLAKQA
ncbi:MAG: hypothetical protein OEW60_06765, partial [Thiovulaceae bacterium]|nr:hypothetical protein [Sulfurimonadaceae bacterium]